MQSVHSLIISATQYPSVEESVFLERFSQSQCTQRKFKGEDYSVRLKLVNKWLYYSAATLTGVT